MTTKATLKLSRDMRGNQGLHIFDEDILLLQQIMVHQSMRATALHEMYRMLGKYLNSEKTITNRLRKLQDAGLIVQSRVKLKGSYFLYHYRLGVRGVDLMIELNILPASDREKVLESCRKFSIPSEHTEAMSLIANQVYLTLLANESLVEFTQSRGSAHKDFLHSVVSSNNQEGAGLVPDWVFEFKNTIVCIEVDTGSQRQKMIEKKYKMYVKHAQRFMEEGKRLIVVFSVVDRTILNRFTENRDKRITSIKQLAPPFTEWVEPEIQEGIFEESFQEHPLDLQFYVVSAKQTPSLIERVLMGSQPFSQLDRYEYAQDWVRKAQHVLEKDYQVETQNKEDVFLPRRDRAMDCDALLSWKPKTGGRAKRYAVIYGEEGSVITYQLISTNGARIAKINETERPNYLNLLVCYDEQTNALEDVYGKEQTCELWQTDSTAWIQAMNDGENASAPDMLYAVSQYRKEWRRFDE